MRRLRRLRQFARSIQCAVDAGEHATQCAEAEKAGDYDVERKISNHIKQLFTYRR